MATYLTLLLAGMAAAAEPEVDRLLLALKDPDPEARRAAVVRLGRLGPAAAPASRRLAEALSDPLLRHAAALALVRIGPDCVPALRATLQDGPVGSVEDAARILARLGRAARAATPDLVRLTREGAMPGLTVLVG